MSAGISLAVAALVAATRLGAASSYAEVMLVLVLLGTGCGISLVSLTTAALAGVDARDAGAASGLTNVAQQLGAALGLAVLVNVFGVATHHASIAGGGAARSGREVALLVHGLDEVFAGAALLGLAALVLVMTLVRSGRRPGIEPAPVEQLDAGGDEELWSAA